MEKKAGCDEKWTSCSNGHDWRPASGMARYKCYDCYAVGYRGIVQSQFQLMVTEGEIVAYKCKKCHGPTTKKNKSCLNCRRAR